jgi:hypothetical protein
MPCQARAGLISLLLLLLGLVGCTALPPGRMPGVELADVAYFPQETFQCGPAALATLLQHEGVDVTPQDLLPQVYIPARHGSLQAELIAAARRHDRLPYVIAADATALRRQLDAGKPVLVLQNYGSRAKPLWHYAVVVGQEADGGAWLLRSGTTPRQRLAARRFEATWERADRFGIVLVRPGEIPVDATPGPYLLAAGGLEAAGRHGAAALAYAAATAHWPNDPAAAFAYAGTQIASGDVRAAEGSYRRLLEGAPGFTAARNNLAVLLVRRGCPAAARRELNAARASDTGRYTADLDDTAAEIAARSAAAPAHAADAVDCPPP